MSRIKKTGKQKHIIGINSQLLKLLRMFSWDNWHWKTKYAIERAKSWCGAAGYQMKHALASFLA